jgi:hypothetical protein
MPTVSTSPRVVLMGSMGALPFAGTAWQVLHYLEGFRRLGYDVYYVEDTGCWPYDPVGDVITDDCRYTVQYIAGLMDWLGLSHKWAYRLGAEAEPFGLSSTELARLFEGADALVNLTGSTVLRDEHMRVPVRIYLETDPVGPQIEVAQGRQFTIDVLSAHTHHFTYGENLGAVDCGVPIGMFHYQPTRQPIVLEWWAEQARSTPATLFTTIASWQQDAKAIEWQGEMYYWSKHLEFLKFIDLPQRTKHQFELALACGEPEAIQLLRSHGWHTIDAMSVSGEISRYRNYILGSMGEFTVAKDQNIRLRSGWFSDRSACYLAAGKPVITQDTAFGNNLPTGRGLFSFQTEEDIFGALDAVSTDYDSHCRSAREIAAEFFAADKVVGSMMQRVGV